jgi:hypothetical protein
VGSNGICFKVSKMMLNKQHLMERSKESGENMDRYKRSTNGRMDLNGGGFIMMTQPGGNINAL